MSEILFEDVRFPVPGQGMQRGNVLVDSGRIAACGFAPPRERVQTIAGNGALLTPGLIDIHTHGNGTFVYECGPEALVEGLANLPKFGTTCVLPTLYRVMDRPSLKKLAALAAALDNVQGVRVPGFHLEGPFLALPGAGAETIPGDVELLNDLLAACNGRVTAMSISPDTPNILPIIERLVERGVVPLMTHTRASVQQTVAAIAAGARHATHFYDVFPVPVETDPGVRPVGAVETILADRRVSVDFIADGVHVDPMAIRAALAAKGYGGVILITDSNIGAGLPAGEYDTPWNLSVRADPDGAARIVEPAAMRGSLAGSSLTMDRGMRNLLNWLDLPAEQVWAMGTENPARVMGLRDLGAIRVGAAADLVLWDDKLHVRKTWLAGELVYDREATTLRREPAEAALA